MVVCVGDGSPLSLPRGGGGDLPHGDQVHPADHLTGQQAQVQQHL